jgi:hypothetical protein
MSNSIIHHISLEDRRKEGSLSQVAFERTEGLSEGSRAQIRMLVLLEQKEPEVSQAASSTVEGSLGQLSWSL